MGKDGEFLAWAKQKMKTFFTRKVLRLHKQNVKNTFFHVFLFGHKKKPAACAPSRPTLHRPCWWASPYWQSSARVRAWGGLWGGMRAGEAPFFNPLSPSPGTVWAAVTLLWPHPPDAARPSRATVQAEIDRLKVCGGGGLRELNRRRSRFCCFTHLPRHTAPGPPATLRQARLVMVDYCVVVLCQQKIKIQCAFEKQKNGKDSPPPKTSLSLARLAPSR